jgi:hypothetical protein
MFMTQPDGIIVYNDDNDLKTEAENLAGYPPECEMRHDNSGFQLQFYNSSACAVT